MSARAEVLLWAQRVCAAVDAPAHEVLEVREGATLDECQTAFHRIARSAHPDLHRTMMSADELELLTTAYSKVAAAYQEVRGRRVITTKIQALRPGEAPAATPPAPSPTGELKIQMSSKALVYYRKAELALRRGEVREGLLHLKLAIAADPQSAFLRTALAEVEAEIRKG